jgi:hypothetical protein
MKKYAIIGLFCFLITKPETTEETKKNTQAYKKDLLATIALFICENEHKFNDPTLLAAAQKHKGDRDLKTLFLKLLANKKDPQIGREMLEDKEYQKAEDIFYKALGKKKSSIEALGGQLEEFSNEFVVLFLKMQIDNKKFTPETFAELTQLIAKLEGDEDQVQSPEK